LSEAKPVAFQQYLLSESLHEAKRFKRKPLISMIQDKFMNHQNNSKSLATIATGYNNHNNNSSNHTNNSISNNRNHSTRTSQPDS
jgi:hypothetical protein